MMLSASLFLVFSNFRQDRESSENASEILSELKQQISEPSESTSQPAKYDDIFREYENDDESSAEEEYIRIDDNYYIGTIYIPSLDIELPVMSEWSYPSLKLSPCRYKGSISEGNLIIAAHN